MIKLEVAQQNTSPTYPSTHADEPRNPCGDGKSYTATNHCTNRGCLIGANVPKPSKEDLRAARLNRFVH